MKLEQQVCSLELAKRLKELGVRQESYFGWFEKWRSGWVLGDMSDVMNYAKTNHDYSSAAPKYRWEFYSAFTVAELGEMLPASIFFRGADLYLKYWRSADHSLFSIGYEKNDGQKEIIQFAETEADARANMLIYLLQNKLITLQ